MCLYVICSIKTIIMGCDGGTIPRRDELVRVKKKPEAKDKDSELSFQWRCCAITQQVLQEPIVVCGLGRIYSKESVIEMLLNKETTPEECKHIKSLKDVKNLQLTPNPAYVANEDKKGGSTALGSAPFICPVIGLEMSGKFRFVALWSCGCVFSERALKEIATKTCHKCQQPFAPDDVVVINGNDDDLVVMQSRLASRQTQNKKNKKKVKVVETEPVGCCSSSKNAANVYHDKVVPSKRCGAVFARNESENAKKAKADYSIAHDPDATDVYKSLFTTHKSEKEQDRAHWITYNPFYN